MPSYDYKCPKCEGVFEVTRGIRETGDVACPECDVAARRIFSPVGIVFKGTGFHNTDNRAKKAIPAPPEGAPAGEKKAEKPACSGDSSPACSSCPAAE